MQFSSSREPSLRSRDREAANEPAHQFAGRHCRHRAGVMAMSIFTVDQRQFAWFSSWVKSSVVITEPGLNFKIPMIQNVRYFEKRIITLDNNEPERFITSEKKNVLVDSYIKWRIVDPKLYYISVGGDEARAKTRLNQTVNAGLREEFGKRTGA
jgi:membrane protease subunit HflC